MPALAKSRTDYETRFPEYYAAGANNDARGALATVRRVGDDEGPHRFRNNGQETARILFFFAPAGIEGLFDELAKMEVPAGDFSSLIKALNVLGEGYGVEYLPE